MCLPKNKTPMQSKITMRIKNNLKKKLKKITNKML